MKFFSKREPRIDTDALERQAEESLQLVKEQQPHVTALTTWLNNRKGQNGLGEDFEITLRPGRA